MSTPLKRTQSTSTEYRVTWDTKYWGRQEMIFSHLSDAQQEARDLREDNPADMNVRVWKREITDWQPINQSQEIR